MSHDWAFESSSATASAVWWLCKRFMTFYVTSAQVVIMALIVGSLFSGQGHDPSEARNYFGVAFLAIMFLSMGAMPELGITFGNKP